MEDLLESYSTGYYYLMQFLEVEVVSGDSTPPNDARNLNFTWALEGASDLDLTIDVEYEDPAVVSRGESPDLLVLRFWAYFTFTNMKGVSIEPFTELRTEIQRQQIPSEPSISMEAVEIFASATLYTVILSFLLKFVLKTLLERLLSLIQALTLISHMMLIDVWYPQNCQTFFGTIFSLLAFDFIPTEYFYPLIFGIHDEPFAD